MGHVSAAFRHDFPRARCAEGSLPGKGNNSGRVLSFTMEACSIDCINRRTVILSGCGRPTAPSRGCRSPNSRLYSAVHDPLEALVRQMRKDCRREISLSARPSRIRCSRPAQRISRHPLRPSPLGALRLRRAAKFCWHFSNTQANQSGHCRPRQAIIGEATEQGREAQRSLALSLPTIFSNRLRCSGVRVRRIRFLPSARKSSIWPCRFW